MSVFLSEREAQTSERYVKLLTEVENLRQVSLFDIAKVKSGTLLCSLSLDAYSLS